MRAERLLRIVVLLRARGRLTAGELARELEVSTRTVQRDMEALSGAGIPVYATRGGDGGWSLLKNYRTSLTGLTASDLVAIVVGRAAGLLSELGLDDPGDSPVLKLMEATSPSAKQQAEHARQRVHIDLASWGEVGPPILPVLQRAVWEDRLITMRYRGGSHFTVAPLGLVSKGGTWYLVASRNETVRTYHAARVHDVAITDESFERPADFDLVEYWQRSERDFTQTLPSYVVKLRVRGDALVRVGWAWAKSKNVSEPARDGWANVSLDVQDEETALRTVRLLGNDVVVRAPASLRRLALREAQLFAYANLR